MFMAKSFKTLTAHCLNQNFRLKNLVISCNLIKNILYNRGGGFMCFGKWRNLFLLLMCFSLISCSKQELARQKQIGSIQAGEKPAYLYKVLSMDDWGKTCRTIHLSSMDAGFIHLSTEEQLDKIVGKYWADASEYVVLKIETLKLLGNLVLEANPGGETKYYHMYNGSIPLNAVMEMKVHKK